MIHLWGMRGVPWKYPAWQELTGIKELFPEDDSLLPCGWTRAQANDILSYFDQYLAKPTTEDRQAFAKSSKLPGRKLWRDFITKGWKTWGINDKIIQVLRHQNAHPFILAQETRDREMAFAIANGKKMPTDGSNESYWPESSTYIPAAIDGVGEALFGDDCFSPITERVIGDLRKDIQVMLQRTWATLAKQWSRSEKKLDALGEAARAAMQGKSSLLSPQSSTLKS